MGLLLTTVFWGLTFIMIKWTIDEMDLYHFMFFRFALAFLALAAVFRKHLKTNRKTIGAAAILSFFLGIAYITQTEGLKFTSASNSALITGLYIVLVPIFSPIIFRTKPTAVTTIGMMLSLFGLFLLTQYSWAGVNFGDAITLICAVACAWHIIMIGKFTHHHETIPLVLYQFLFVAVLCGLIALFRGTISFDLPKIGWITVIVTALFATAVAFVVQTAAQRVIDPTRTGLILVMEAVFGAFFAWCLGGEQLTAAALLGACLMVVGMMVSEVRPVAKYLLEKIVG